MDKAAKEIDTEGNASNQPKKSKVIPLMGNGRDVCNPEGEVSVAGKIIIRSCLSFAPAAAHCQNISSSTVQKDGSTENI